MGTTHLGRAAAISHVVGKALGLNRSALQGLKRCAGLHDVGKARIPSSILDKPGPLTFSEREIVKRHTWIGAQLLDRQGLPKKFGLVALTHHERWDGSGYPYGLKGHAIPLFTRIVSLADVYDALVSERCYKPAYPVNVALQIIKANKGTHFDPGIVETFIHQIPAITRIQ